MGNQMSLEENENEQNEIKVIEKNDSESIESNQTDGTIRNKKIKKNTQDMKGDVIKKRRSTSKSGSTTFKKTRSNRRR